MKLTAQVFDGLVNQRTSSYVASLVRSISPGQFVQLASGERCRVVGKAASAKGIRIQLAKRDGYWSPQKLATLHPVPAAGMRLARLVHTVLAADMSLSSYVNSAIDQAGLPKDPDMNWDKWLGSVFNTRLMNFTKDLDLVEDTIRDIITNELFEKRILEKNFNPDHPSLEGKDLAHKVSAYLSYIFKRDVDPAITALKRHLGPGAYGQVGQNPTVSLSTGDSQEEGTEDAFVPDDHNLILKRDSGEDERLGAEEVHGFINAFREWYHDKAGSRPYTLAAMDFITERIEDGYSKAEIRAEALGENSPLVGRDGKPYNTESWKKLMQSWAGAMTSFAESRFNPYADTGTSKAIVNRAQKAASFGNLRLAMEDTGVDPHAPYSNNTNATTVVEPKPPVNPNVQQQQNSMQNKNQQSPQEQQNAQGEEDIQSPGTRVTIPPEIPGVNHA